MYLLVRPFHAFVTITFRETVEPLNRQLLIWHSVLQKYIHNYSRYQNISSSTTQGATGQPVCYRTSPCVQNGSDYSSNYKNMLLKHPRPLHFIYQPTTRTVLLKLSLYISQTCQQRLDKRQQMRHLSGCADTVTKPCLQGVKGMAS